MWKTKVRLVFGFKIKIQTQTLMRFGFELAYLYCSIAALV